MTKIFDLVSSSLSARFTRSFAAANTEELAAVEAGEFTLLRVDYVVHCDAGTEDQAIFLQQQLKKSWMSSNASYSHYQNDKTLYINQHSRRWTLKSYLKGQEVEAKGGLDGVVYGPCIEAGSKRLLRFELTLRSMRLKEKQLTSPLAWTKEAARSLMRIILKKHLAGINRSYPSAKSLDFLNAQQKLIVLAMHSEVPISSIYDKRALKRFRDIILKKSGIDINLPEDIAFVGQHFTQAKALIANGVTYKSSNKLFSTMCKANPVSHSCETSDISDLMG